MPAKKARGAPAGKAVAAREFEEEDEEEGGAGRGAVVEDERFAAAAAMRGGDDSESDGSEGRGSDGSDEDDEESGLASFAAGGAQQPKGQDKLWADPTHAEMKGLKESELHFKSSLLRLQMDELKAQVSIDYTKASGLETWLHRFKEVLEALPACTLSTASLPEDSAVKEMQFKAPAAVHMVGSYLLRTVTRPDLVVDLVLEMPADLLEHKDFLNNKYLERRQLYLAHVAHRMQSHDSVAAVSFGAFRGDATKPCVLFKPAGLSGLSGKFTVRVLAAPPANSFPLARFRPSRNNFRKKGVTDIALQPPTPAYNYAVVEDLRMVHHLQLLHAEFSGCVALAETATLLKVWLRQRSMNSAADGINGFILSAVLLYLVQKRQISRSMSCYHMLRAAFVFLSKAENLTGGVHLTPAADAKISPTEALTEFVGGGQPVLLDDSLALNLMGRVSASALKEVQHEARAALLCLEQDANNGFAPLMLQRVSQACKFDEVLVVRAGAPDAEGEPLREGGGKWEESDEILGEVEPGITPADAVARRALRVVEEALGDRLHFARLLSREAVEAPIHAQTAGKGGGGAGGSKTMEQVLEAQGWGGARGGGSTLVIGLLLNAEGAGRKVERGPPAEDVDAARRFRKFWGSKSELRRFKDGAIQETLVWAEVEILAQTPQPELQQTHKKKCTLYSDFI